MIEDEGNPQSYTVAVIDPLGSIPVYKEATKKFDKKKSGD